MDETKELIKQLKEIKRFIVTHDKWRKTTSSKQASRYAKTMSLIMAKAEKQGWFPSLDLAVRQHLYEVAGKL